MKGLLFITHQTRRYGYLQSVEMALRGGCRQIQLRMKEVPPNEVEAVAKLAKALCDRHRASLFINDHVAVCQSVGATGVHLGKTDMPPAKARHMLGAQAVIGATANSFEDILTLAGTGIDYVGLGPFRFTATKKNLSPVIGLSGYQDIIKQCRDRGIGLPIFAIGGIRRTDIPDLLQAGVSGIALSSAILEADDPVSEMREIGQRFDAGDLPYF